MTRKDYIALAAAIKGARSLESMPACQMANERTAEAIAEILAQDNPRFDHIRFMKAAGAQIE